MTVAVDVADRRGRLLALTPAGHKLLRAALPVWKRTHRAIERSLADADADQLRADLRALSRHHPT